MVAVKEILYDEAVREAGPHNHALSHYNFVLGYISALQPAGAPIITVQHISECTKYIFGRLDGASALSIGNLPVGVPPRPQEVAHVRELLHLVRGRQESDTEVRDLATTALGTLVTHHPTTVTDDVALLQGNRALEHVSEQID